MRAQINLVCERLPQGYSSPFKLILLVTSNARQINNFNYTVNDSTFATDSRMN